MSPGDSTLRVGTQHAAAPVTENRARQIIYSDGLRKTPPTGGCNTKHQHQRHPRPYLEMPLEAAGASRSRIRRRGPRGAPCCCAPSPIPHPPTHWILVVVGLPTTPAPRPLPGPLLPSVARRSAGAEAAGEEGATNANAGTVAACER